MTRSTGSTGSTGIAIRTKQPPYAGEPGNKSATNKAHRGYQNECSVHTHSLANERNSFPFLLGRKATLQARAFCYVQHLKPRFQPSAPFITCSQSSHRSTKSCRHYKMRQSNFHHASSGSLFLFAIFRLHTVKHHHSSTHSETPP